MMETLRRWRTYLTLKVLLVVLALLMGGVAFYQARQNADLHRQLAGVQAELSQSRKLLTNPETGQELEALQRQIKEFQANQAVVMPTHQQALSVGNVLSDFAAQRGLRVVTLKIGTGAAPKGADQYPAVALSMEMQGQMTDILAMLAVADEASLVFVERLAFTKAQGGGVLWTVKVDLKAVYQ